MGRASHPGQSLPCPRGPTESLPQGEGKECTFTDLLLCARDLRHPFKLPTTLFHKGICCPLCLECSSFHLPLNNSSHPSGSACILFPPYRFPLTLCFMLPIILSHKPFSGPSQHASQCVMLYEWLSPMHVLLFCALFFHVSTAFMAVPGT